MQTAASTSHASFFTRLEKKQEALHLAKELNGVH